MCFFWGLTVGFSPLMVPTSYTLFSFLSIACAHCFLSYYFTACSLVIGITVVVFDYVCWVSAIVWWFLGYYCNLYVGKIGLGRTMVCIIWFKYIARHILIKFWSTFLDMTWFGPYLRRYRSSCPWHSFFRLVLDITGTKPCCQKYKALQVRWIPEPKFVRRCTYWIHQLEIEELWNVVSSASCAIVGNYPIYM